MSALTSITSIAPYSNVIEQVTNWFYFIAGVKLTESQFQFCNNHISSTQTRDGLATTYHINTLLLEQKFAGARALCQAVFSEFLDEVIRMTYNNRAFEDRKFVGLIDFEKGVVRLLVRTRGSVYMKPFLNRSSDELRESLVQAVVSKIETNIELVRQERDQLNARIAAMEEVLKIKQKP